MAEPTEDELKALGVEDDEDLSALGVTDDVSAAEPPPFEGAEATAEGLRPLSAEEASRGAVANFAQGAFRNWADEVSGSQAMFRVLGENPDKPPDERVDPWWAYRNARDRFRNVEESFRSENPKTAFGLSVGGGLLVGPPATKATGLVRYLPNIAEGALAGAGAAAESEDMGRGAVLGGALGGAARWAGEAAGSFANYLSQRAGSKVAAAGEKAQQMAADKVAAEVASAKGLLGSRTQEANRFVENLLRLESTGALTGEQAHQLAMLRQSGILPALEQKLADAMLDEVPGAAGRVDIARSAYEGLASRANEATDQAAQEILSGAEAKRQIGERVKRYLPTVVGSLKGAVAGGATGALLGGSPTEALVGALAGAGIRPAVRATQRMMAHPAVQSAVNRPIQSIMGGVAAGATGAIEAGLPQALTTATAERVSPSEGDFVRSLATSNPEALGQYAGVLQQAAADNRLPLVHWHLQQTDPQYRATLEAARKEGQQ